MWQRFELKQLGGWTWRPGVELLLSGSQSPSSFAVPGMTAMAYSCVMH